jgi:hypothetical protein
VFNVELTGGEDGEDRANPKVAVTVRKGDRVLGKDTVALVIGERKKALSGSYSGPG